jgi:hypothetical protein
VHCLSESVTSRRDHSDLERESKASKRLMGSHRTVTTLCLLAQQGICTIGTIATLYPLVQSRICTLGQRTLASAVFSAPRSWERANDHQFVVFSHPQLNHAVMQSIPAASGTQSTIYLLTQPGFHTHQHLKVVWLRAHGDAHKYASSATAATCFESS